MKSVGGWDWRNILIERLHRARLQRRLIVASGLSEEIPGSISVLCKVEEVAFADLCDMGQTELANLALTIAESAPLPGHIAESHALWRNAAP